MLLGRRGIAVGSLHSSSWTQQAVSSRQCVCRAKRGRPRKTDVEPAPEEFQQPVEAASPVPKRRGRARKTDLQAEEPEATTAPAAAVELGQHDRVISYEQDITASWELDYTDDTALSETVPQYTHQAQGHDSNDQPILEVYQPPDFAITGFVGDEAVDAATLQAQAAEAAQAVEAPLVPAAGGIPGMLAGAGAGTSGQLAELTAAAVGGEDDEELIDEDEPPGVYDYEAGLAEQVTLPEPEHKLQFMPPEWRPRSRREADYMIRWANWVSVLDSQDVQTEYENMARRYMCLQNRESENIYLTTKALAVVTAEIELEDHETSNRWDIFYPVWARAEHRWYPTGRFAAYNEYVKENIPHMTMKYAPGADQEEEFDVMDDVFLLADDPNMPGGEGEGEAQSGPARGLGLDSFLSGVLPGAASSELGASYLEDVLAPTEEEVVEEDE